MTLRFTSKSFFCTRLQPLHHLLSGNKRSSKQEPSCEFKYSQARLYYPQYNTLAAPGFTVCFSSSASLLNTLSLMPWLEHGDSPPWRSEACKNTPTTPEGCILHGMPKVQKRHRCSRLGFFAIRLGLRRRKQPSIQSLRCTSERLGHLPVSYTLKRSFYDRHGIQYNWHCVSACWSNRYNVSGILALYPGTIDCERSGTVTDAFARRDREGCAMCRNIRLCITET